MFYWLGSIRFILLVSLAFIMTDNYAVNKNSDTENFFHMLYNYQFKSADSLLNCIEKQENDSKLLELIKVTYSWQRLMSGYDDKKSIENCLEFTQTIINKHLNSYSNTNSCNYYLILLYGYKGRLSNMLGNKITGIKAFFDGIKYLEKIDTCVTENKDFYFLTCGIYNCLISYAYDNHPYLFLFNNYSKYANKQYGIKLLKQGANSNLNFIQVESLYFLVKIYNELENSSALSLHYVNLLIVKVPENLLFHSYKLQLLKQQGQLQQAKDMGSIIQTTVNTNIQLDSIQSAHFLHIALL